VCVCGGGGGAKTTMCVCKVIKKQGMQRDQQQARRLAMADGHGDVNGTQTSGSLAPG
jgi:hypothetical protein